MRKRDTGLGAAIVLRIVVFERVDCAQCLSDTLRLPYDSLRNDTHAGSVTCSDHSYHVLSIMDKQL